MCSENMIDKSKLDPSSLQKTSSGLEWSKKGELPKLWLYLTHAMLQINTLRYSFDIH